MLLQDLHQKIKNYFLRKKAIHFNQLKKDGNFYLSVGNYNDAEECYNKMISIFPNRADGYINVGFVCIESNRFDDAEFYITKAIEIDNTNPDSLYMLGNVYHKKNNIKKAIEYFLLAARFCKDSDLFVTLFNSFFDLNRKKEAVDCLYRARLITPNDQSIGYLIDSIDGMHRPDTAPPAYIKNLFDGYADSFEKNLVEELGYCAPQALFELVDQAVDLRARRFSILDLGCGTGLVGRLIAPYSATLVGVDLSSNMLNKVRELNIYTRLENTDLVSMMRNEPANSYDIVMAADVFIYVGKLDDTFTEVRRVLKPHGLFVFSLEALEQTLEADAHKTTQQDFRLNTTSRYAHSSAYIHQLAVINNFTVCKMISGELRKNSGNPVAGWYVLCELNQ